MNTIDRILALCLHYNLPSPWSYVDGFSCGSGVHDVLDTIDIAAGISTKWHDGHGCTLDDDSYDPEGQWWCAGDHNKPNYVGARVALHEQHMARSLVEPLKNVFTVRETEPLYFWLGAEADTIGAGSLNNI